MTKARFLPAALALQAALAMPTAPPAGRPGPPELPSGVQYDPQAGEEWLRKDIEAVEARAAALAKITPQQRRGMRDKWEAAGQPAFSTTAP